MITKRGETKIRPGLYVAVEDTGMSNIYGYREPNPNAEGELILDDDGVVVWTGRVEPKLNENKIVEYTPTPTITGAGVVMIDD